MTKSLSNKFNKLPRYLFAEIDEMKRRIQNQGMDIINLSIGDPDQPTPPHIIDQLYKSSKEPKNHNYPPYNGIYEFRETIVSWFTKRFNVKLDPQTEILTLIGAKEGIFHSPLAFINSGDVVLIPNPGYPVYYGGTIFADGIPYFMPLLRKNNFLPDLSIIPQNILNKARIIFINYPNNPTTAIASIDFFKQLVEFCYKNNIIILHDNPYGEITLDDYVSPSILQVDGAKEISIEFHSLSKTYNMTGWRIGFAVGNKNLIKALTTIKENADSGVFIPIQYAGIEALSGPQECVLKMRNLYKERRDTFVEGAKKLNWDVIIPIATLYVWVPISYSSIKFSKMLLEKAGVVVTPGIGFGEYGEGYIRIALTADKERIQEAVERIKKVI